METFKSLGRHVDEVWQLIIVSAGKVRTCADDKTVWTLVIAATTTLLILTFSLLRSPKSQKVIRNIAIDENSDCTRPVLVVGAGPTGLTLTNVLRRYGVPVRLIEKKAVLSQHTKATNLMQRNQEYLFALGLLKPLQQVSGAMRRLMVHAYGKSFGPRTMRLHETPFTDVLLCGQHNFEAVLAKGLTDQSMEIDFDTELVDIQQGQDGVAATTVNAGKKTIEKYSYVVGCDGAFGVSRSFTKLDFQLVKTGVAIRQVDCKLSWRRLHDTEQMWLFYVNHGFVVVVPLPGNICRVLSIEPKHAMPERKPTLKEMESRLQQVAADETVTLSDPLWFSYTDLSMGLAPSLREGRIFLAGDVGNPVLPNGGQGMNTGIADAFNLGWKLAAVLRHCGSSALLDTFNEERHAVRAALQTAQYNSLKYTTLVTPWLMQAAFRWFADPVLNWGGEYAMAQAFSELTINTRKSALSMNGIGDSKIRAGDRALDTSITYHSQRAQLYDLIYCGSWTLLCFSGVGSFASDNALITAVSCIKRDDLRTFLLLTKSYKGMGNEFQMLYDLDEEAHRKYGVSKPTVFLVRPDGHVGLKVQPTQIGLLVQYLHRWLPDASQSFI